MASTTTVRRRDAVKTRGEILQAAVEVFGAQGYAQAGLREIAAKAGTAASLPLRYFGTKAALFEAALIETIRQNSVFAWEKAEFGKTMARLIHDRSNVTISVMLIQALSEPEAHAVAAKVWRTHMIAPLEEWLGPPNAQARANNLFAVLTGVTLQVHGLASGQASPEQLQWVAETLQSIVDAGGQDAHP